MKSVLGTTQEEPKANKKKVTMRIHKTLAQNIIFNTISTFLVHFVNFKCDFEKSKRIVLELCKKYELDPARTHLLISELQAV